MRGVNQSRNKLHSLLGIETIAQAVDKKVEEITGRNKLHSLLGIETSEAAGDTRHGFVCRNKLHSLLGIETTRTNTRSQEKRKISRNKLHSLLGIET